MAEGILHGTAAGRTPSQEQLCSESPVTDGKFIYVYVGNMGLWAFDLKGKPVWSTPLEANPIYLDFGTGSSPALAGNLLVIVNDNEKQQYIAAFDKKTGKQVWRTNRDSAQGTAGAVSMGDAIRLAARAAHRNRDGWTGRGRELRPDGKELWRMSGMSARRFRRLSLTTDCYISTAGADGALFAIRPGATGDISLAKDQTSNEYVVWSQPRAGTYLPSHGL